MIVQYAFLKCYTIQILLIFPFLQTNITVQMRPSGGWGKTKVDKSKKTISNVYGAL